MKRQEVFDKVATHLLMQGKKARLNHTSSTCAYRGFDNTKCAVGCLIPDELYDHKMENRTVEALLTDWPKVRKLLGGTRNKGFLVDLQFIHDIEATGAWEGGLRRFATKYNLSPKVLQ